MANKAEPSSTYSEASFVTSKNDLKHKFYRPDVSEMIVPVTRAFLENYSHIPVDAQPAHIEEIREKAWNIRAYPCVGLGVYLVPQLRRLPAYPEIIQRVVQGQVLADIGCFIGHDLRHLVNDGAPARNLYGFDIIDFWDLGFEMFQDRDRFKAHFVQADIMAADSKLAEFKGKLDITYIAQVLHQWNWDGQIEACKRLTSLSKPGSLIVGNQIGNSTAQAIVLDSIPLPLWRHNEQSFEKLWQEVGVATDTTWECSSWLRNFEEMSWRAEDSAWMEEGACVLEFVVRRVT
ncbi:hypothetical protein MBLNU13_g11411t2 [Cladosporium sp. NU13]